MTQTLKKAARMAVITEMKEPGSIRFANMPKSIYNQELLALLQKKDSLHSLLMLCKSQNKKYSEDEICEYLSLEKEEYGACMIALVREGRV